MNAARDVVPRPTASTRIGIEIFFRAKKRLRADVDNIIKPILDALKGIVYLDDSQVRMVRATTLPCDDAYKVPGWTSQEVLIRLTASSPQEFLINIFEGLSIPGSPRM